MCIFCKIINQEIPSHKFYEDDKVIAFLDIKPVNPGHALVVPKAHYETIEEISETDLTAVILAVKKVGGLLKDKLGVEGYNVTVNNGAVAGQAVNHLHFHVIPRHAGDGHVSWPQSDYAPGEAEEIVKKLTS
ncbi:MAG: HIT family protein [Patescibacteria group bacterium]|jgi:histidine triad (HIT) family protein